jgi:hypothetical protein
MRERTVPTKKEVNKEIIVVYIGQHAPEEKYMRKQRRK